MIIKIGTGDMCIMENVYVVMVEEYDDKPEPIGIVHNEECEEFHICGRYFVSKCDDCGYRVAKVNGVNLCCHYFSTVLNQLIDSIETLLKKVTPRTNDFNNLSKEEKMEIILQEKDYMAR